jgi:hypothetical protein
MWRSPTSSRRTMLWLIGSVLAAVSLAPAFPGKSVAKALGCLPGSLSLLPLHDKLFRHARRYLHSHPGSRSLAQTAQIYLRSPDNPHSLARFEQQVRRDFVAGRVTIVDGWVVADTELALLALVTRPL